jgi:hypothetical protein
MCCEADDQSPDYVVPDHQRRHWFKLLKTIDRKIVKYADVARVGYTDYQFKLDDTSLNDLTKSSGFKIAITDQTSWHGKWANQVGSINVSPSTYLGTYENLDKLIRGLKEDAST